MSNTQQTQSGGVGFSSLLAIVFITLKLLGIITWSWVWVLSPIWIPIALVILILLFTLGIMGIAAFFTTK